LTQPDQKGITLFIPSLPVFLPAINQERSRTPKSGFPQDSLTLALRYVMNIRVPETGGE
jgi:hypothetical protein